MKSIVFFILIAATSFLSHAQKMNQEFGLMVIDVQKFFIPNHKESIYKEFGINHPLKSEDIIANLTNVIKWANQQELKTFVTFEGSDSNRFNLPDELIPLLPKAKTYQFIKTNFNALQHEEFKKEVLASGIKKWVVVGAETDVCIYQTVKGLRKLGFDVYLVNEAIYSGRINTSNALYNLQQFGVNMISVKNLAEIRKVKTPRAVLSVQDNLKTEDLLLTVFTSETQKGIDTSAQKVRLEEIKKFAEGLSIPIEFLDPQKAISVENHKNKIRLIVGNINKDLYSQMKQQCTGSIIVVSDCILGKEFENLNKDWYMLTYKMIFYDVLGNIASGDSPKLSDLIKSKKIKWPDYTQN